MIIELVKDLDRCIDEVMSLKDNQDYLDALNEYEKNNKLMYRGYSLNIPYKINKVFVRYVEAVCRVDRYRESDKNYLRNIVDLGELGYLYEK